MGQWYPACGGSCSLNTDTHNHFFRQTGDDPLDLSDIFLEELLPPARMLASSENFSDYDLATPRTPFSRRTPVLPTAPSPMDWQTLPHHVLLRIFRGFSGQDLAACLGRVCRRWYRTAYDSSLWRSLNLRLKNLSPERCLAARELLEELRPDFLSLFAAADLNSEETLEGRLIPSLPNLRSLDLGFNAGFSTDVARILVHAFPALTALNLEGIKELDDIILGRLAFGLPNLTHICLSHCIQVSDTGLERLARTITDLQMLSIDGIDRINDQGIEALVRLQGPNLRRLYIDGGELSDNAIAAVANNCPNLTLFSVSFWSAPTSHWSPRADLSEGLTDASLESLRKLRYLTHLHIRKGREFSGDAIRDLFSEKVLSSTFMSKPWLEGGLGGLRWLSMGECSGLSDGAVKALTRANPDLESLCLSWCWSVSETGFGYIVQRLRGLVWLCMEGCKFVEGACLRSAPPLLRWMDFRMCNLVSFRSLLFLDLLGLDMVSGIPPTDALPQLRYLDLREDGPVRDEEVEALVDARGGSLTVANYYGELVTTESLEARRRGEAALFVGSDREKYRAIIKAGQSTHGTCCMTSY